MNSLLKSFSGKKVFVTGHTGFKGSWLCEWLLLLGAEVTGFSLPEAPSKPSLFEQIGLSPRLTDIRGDIRDFATFKKDLSESKPDFVFHLAAQPLVRESYRQPLLTFETNTQGTGNVLEALRLVEHPCSAVFITTDKCYENREIDYAYKESDPLGGHDPYSASKAAAEILIASYRQSFFDKKDSPVRIASARAGNVIGGGDWSPDRIIPDAVRALSAAQPIPVRNQGSTRPWQHVAEPIGGYLLLASLLQENPDLRSAFNFGPPLSSNRTVRDVVEEMIKNWPGSWVDASNPSAPHEAGKLNLSIEKARDLLNWNPKWNFETALQKTAEWYRFATKGANGADLAELTRKQIASYTEN